MNVEFEEFDSVEDIFLYMASISPPMKKCFAHKFLQGVYLLNYTIRSRWRNFPNGLHERFVRKWNLRI